MVLCVYMFARGYPVISVCITFRVSCSPAIRPSGLLQSRISTLSHERSECSVEMIGECASGVGQGSRQTCHTITHLRFGGTKGIGTLAFQFEHLSQFRPRAVVGQHTTYRDHSHIFAPMSFLHGTSGAKIVGQSRGASQLAMGLEEHFDLLS